MKRTDVSTSFEETKPTFCILSLYQLKATQLYLLIVFLWYIQNLCFIFMDKKYFGIFYTPGQLKCQQNAHFSILQRIWSTLFFSLYYFGLIEQIFQIFEWKAMLMLILFQQNKSIGNLTYQYNNKKTQKNSYREKENRLRLFFFFTGTLVLSFQLFGLIDSYWFQNDWSIRISICNFFVVLAFVYYFVRLFYSMNKFHFYEFKKTRKQMLVYFICYLITSVYNNVNLLGYRSFISDPWNLETKFEICTKKQDLGFLTMKVRLYFGYFSLIM